MNLERLEDRHMLACEIGKDFSVVSNLVDPDATVYESQASSAAIGIKRTFSEECHEFSAYFAIDWGDGSPTDRHHSTEDFGSRDTDFISHAYKQPGTYHLTVSEVRTGFVIESRDITVADRVLDITYPYEASVSLESSATTDAFDEYIARMQNFDVYETPIILGHNFEPLIGKYGHLEFTAPWTRIIDVDDPNPYVTDIPYGLTYHYTSPKLMNFPDAMGIHNLRYDTFVAQFVDDEGNSSAVEFKVSIFPRRTPLVVLGDIDGDRRVTERDRDMFFKEAFADADMDGDIDADDVTLMRELFGIPVGDANLDGVFDSGDLVLLFQHGKYEAGKSAHWNRGDFNGDGLFDSGDLVAAFIDGGYLG